MPFQHISRSLFINVVTSEARRPPHSFPSTTGTLLVNDLQCVEEPWWSRLNMTCCVESPNCQVLSSHNDQLVYIKSTDLFKFSPSGHPLIAVTNHLLPSIPRCPKVEEIIIATAAFVQARSKSVAYFSNDHDANFLPVSGNIAQDKLPANGNLRPYHGVSGTRRNPGKRDGSTWSTSGSAFISPGDVDGHPDEAIWDEEIDVMEELFESLPYGVKETPRKPIVAQLVDIARPA